MSSEGCDCRCLKRNMCLAWEYFFWYMLGEIAKQFLDSAMAAQGFTARRMGLIVVRSATHSAGVVLDEAWHQLEWRTIGRGA